MSVLHIQACSRLLVESGSGYKTEKFASEYTVLYLWLQERCLACEH